MVISIVIIFCFASAHCAPLASSSQTLELPLAEGGRSLQPALPSRGCNRTSPFVNSCADAHECGVYTMLIGGIEKEVYCEVSVTGRKFIVIQRRGDFGDPIDYFFNEWIEYKLGFGDPRKQVWIGNDALFFLTSNRQDLYIDMEDFKGIKLTVILHGVQISDEDSHYTLSMLSSSPQSMTKKLFDHHNGNKFSTKDRDNDDADISCANRFKAGWWFKKCGEFGLNGLYLKGPHSSYGDGINYYKFRGFYYSLKSTVMKLRVK